jgi:hypothetical protein
VSTTKSTSHSVTVRADASVNHLLCGLAANTATALPSEPVDRLIEVADAGIAAELVRRADLSHAQAVTLVSRVAESAVLLAYKGKLTAADIDPVAQPDAALALAAGLAEHPHGEVRRAVAANGATPPAVLAALISGKGLPPARWCPVCWAG